MVSITEKYLITSSCGTLPVFISQGAESIESLLAPSLVIAEASPTSNNFTVCSVAFS